MLMALPCLERRLFGLTWQELELAGKKDEDALENMEAGRGNGGGYGVTLGSDRQIV